MCFVERNKPCLTSFHNKQDNVTQIQIFSENISKTRIFFNLYDKRTDLTLQPSGSGRIPVPASRRPMVRLATPEY